jgi:hypothetical protein
MACTKWGTKKYLDLGLLAQLDLTAEAEHNADHHA